MKIHVKYIAINLFLIGMLFSGCKKSVLDEQGPETALTINATFSNYNSFLTYSWNFYNVFPAYDGSLITYDVNSDLFEAGDANSQSQWIAQTIAIPTTSGDYSTPYKNIRAINLMLDNIDGSALKDLDKKHMRSIGYFFRAYNYANLVNLYGDVPYVSTALTDTSTSVLYQKRTARDIVAKNIMDDLNYALANIAGHNDGSNTINENVVLALISRFGLREGTWRKYHGLANADIYIQASSAASAKLMTAFPSLISNYDLVFNSANLAGMPGIILYKQYATGQLTHNLSEDARRDAGEKDLTKAAMDLILCTDGLPTSISPLFQGDKSPYTEFRNRDRRLYYMVPPPYKVEIPTSTSQTYTFTNNPADSSYFGFMAGISDPSHKTLPILNYTGKVMKQEPHFQDDLNGQNNASTYTGYRFYKFSNRLTGAPQVGGDINNAPIFRIGEVLLNYAEAMYELGTFNQATADATINKLRARGKVAPLLLTSIPADPNRDPTVAATLWEIRRERAVELMGEGFRYDDLRRWKKMDYVIKRKLGRYITKGVDVSANAKIPILNGANAGYISYEPQPPATFPDYYYLYPIPSQEIVLNPKIVQNPGWK